MNNPRSAKRQRERERQERAERKRQRRVERLAADADGPVVDSVASQQQVLDALGELHVRFADGQMSIDDFEAAKRDLTGQLRVD